MPTTLGLYEMCDVTDAVPVSITGDGSVRLVNPSPHGGSWAFRIRNAAGDVIMQAASHVLPRELHPLTTVSNNVTEVLALLAGLEWLSTGTPIVVRTDSLNAIRVFRDHGTDRDWLPPEIMARVRRVVARLGAMSFELLAGHPTKAHLVLLEAGLDARNGSGHPFCIHNHWCDLAAKQAWTDYETQLGGA